MIHQKLNVSLNHKYQELLTFELPEDCSKVIIQVTEKIGTKCRVKVFGSMTESQYTSKQGWTSIIKDNDELLPGGETALLVPLILTRYITIRASSADNSIIDIHVYVYDGKNNSKP